MIVIHRVTIDNAEIRLRSKHRLECGITHLSVCTLITGLPLRAFMKEGVVQTARENEIYRSSCGGIGKRLETARRTGPRPRGFSPINHAIEILRPRLQFTDGRLQDEVALRRRPRPWRLPRVAKRIVGRDLEPPRARRSRDVTLG